MDPFIQAAIEEAEAGLAEGGIPIGSVVVHDGEDRGPGPQSPRPAGEHHPARRDGRPRTDRPQARLLLPGLHVRTRTLSPCPMCSGAIVLYRIPRIVIGENRSFLGEEAWLASHGVTLEVLQDERCIALMREFTAARPDLWAEDIGTESGEA